MTEQEKEQKIKNILIEVMRKGNGGKETRYEVMNKDIKWNTTCTVIVVSVVLVIAGLFLLKHIL